MNKGKLLIIHPLKWYLRPVTYFTPSSPEGFWESRSFLCFTIQQFPTNE